MGDPKKNRKKYSTPSHPWNATRLKEEGELVDKFGLKNKKEVWKMTSVIKRFKSQAKSLIAGYTEQSEKEKKQLLVKLNKLNLVNETATLDDVLGLKIESVFERRLQTLVFKKGLGRSVKQARQFITNGHISINGKKCNVPSYLVLKDEENKISFNLHSKLNNENHPERMRGKEEVEQEKKHVKEEILGGKKESLVEIQVA